MTTEVTIKVGSLVISLDEVMLVSQSLTSDVRFRRRRRVIIARDRQKWENKYIVKGRFVGVGATKADREESIRQFKADMLIAFKFSNLGLEMSWRYLSTKEPIVDGNGSNAGGLSGNVRGFITRMDFEDDANKEQRLNYNFEFQEAKERS